MKHIQTYTRKMCQEGSCTSVPAKECGIFYAIYCIVIGAISVLLDLLMVLDVILFLDMDKLFIYIGMVASISYILAGVLLLIGILVNR